MFTVFPDYDFSLYLYLSLTLSRWAPNNLIEWIKCSYVKRPTKQMLSKEWKLWKTQISLDLSPNLLTLLIISYSFYLSLYHFFLIPVSLILHSQPSHQCHFTELWLLNTVWWLTGLNFMLVDQFHQVSHVGKQLQTRIDQCELVWKVMST